MTPSIFFSCFRLYDTIASHFISAILYWLMLQGVTGAGGWIVSQLTLGEGCFNPGQVTSLTQDWHLETHSHTLTFTPIIHTTPHRTCMALEVRRKPEYSDGHGVNIQTQKGPQPGIEPSWCSATAPTMAPPCRPSFPFFSFFIGNLLPECEGTSVKL